MGRLTGRRRSSSGGRTDPRVTVQREPHGGKGGPSGRGFLRCAATIDSSATRTCRCRWPRFGRFLPPSAPPFDVAIGTREGMAARRVGEPIYRHLMGRLFNGVVQRLTLPGIEDSQCGFKMFTGPAVDKVFPLVTVDGWAFDVEVLTIARAQQLRIVEVPIEWHYREESRLSIVRDGLRMLTDVVAIRRRARRGVYRSPAPEHRRHLST